MKTVVFDVPFTLKHLVTVANLPRGILLGMAQSLGDLPPRYQLILGAAIRGGLGPGPFDTFFGRFRRFNADGSDGPPFDLDFPDDHPPNPPVPKDLLELAKRDPAAARAILDRKPLPTPPPMSEMLERQWVRYSIPLVQLLVPDGVKIVSKSHDYLEEMLLEGRNVIRNGPNVMRKVMDAVKALPSRMKRHIIGSMIFSTSGDFHHEMYQQLDPEVSNHKVWEDAAMEELPLKETKSIREYILVSEYLRLWGEKDLIRGTKVEADYIVGTQTAKTWFESLPAAVREAKTRAHAETIQRPATDYSGFGDRRLRPKTLSHTLLEIPSPPDPVAVVVPTRVVVREHIRGEPREVYSSGAAPVVIELDSESESESPAAAPVVIDLDSESETESPAAAAAAPVAPVVIDLGTESESSSSTRSVRSVRPTATAAAAAAASDAGATDTDITDTDAGATDTDLTDTDVDGSDTEMVRPGLDFLRIESARGQEPSPIAVRMFIRLKYSVVFALYLAKWRLSEARFEEFRTKIKTLHEIFVKVLGSFDLPDEPESSYPNLAGIDRIVKSYSPLFIEYLENGNPDGFESFIVGVDNYTYATQTLTQKYFDSINRKADTILVLEVKSGALFAPRSWMYETNKWW